MTHVTKKGLHGLGATIKKKLNLGVFIIKPCYGTRCVSNCDFTVTTWNWKNGGKVVLIGQFVISKSDPEWGST